MFQRSSSGFNLIELMIALSIVTLVGSITIPSMFNTTASTNEEKYTAYAREAAQVLVRAYQQYYIENDGIPETLAGADLIPYMNYVNQDTSSVIDQRYGGSSRNCTVGHPCIKLHNGGMILMQNDYNFGVKDKNHYFPVWFDPDGVYSGSTTGQGKSIVIDFHYGGTAVYSANRVTGVDVTYSGVGTPIYWSTDPETPWFKGF